MVKSHSVRVMDLQAIRHHGGGDRAEGNPRAWQFEGVGGGLPGTAALP